MIQHRIKTFRLIALLACLLLLPAVLYAETAAFDALTEGNTGSEFTDGGITFYDLDNGQPGLDNVFIIEDAQNSLTEPEFSSPNGLTATSYTPGSNVGFGAVKELYMTTNTDADSAVVDIFTTAILLLDSNTITLEALKDGAVVDSDSMAVQDLTGDHFTLSVGDVVFDTLRLVSSPDSQALLIDNVTINSIDICECDLNQDSVCDMYDWVLFGEDWGRTDCEESTDTCECDINQDGRCDMYDWVLFGEDWGRADCP